MSTSKHGGPQDFSEYITPQKAHEIDPNNPKRTVAQYTAQAKDHRKCEACNHLPVWRYAGVGLCFPCTTGQSDASDDYELLPL